MYIPIYNHIQVDRLKTSYLFVCLFGNRESEYTRKTIPECEERNCARLVRRTRICSASSRKRQTRTAAWPLAKGILKLDIEGNPMVSLLFNRVAIFCKNSEEDRWCCNKVEILQITSSTTPLGFSVHQQEGCFFCFFFCFCRGSKQKTDKFMMVFFY